MNSDDFLDGLTNQEDKNSEFVASAEHFIRLKQRSGMISTEQESTQTKTAAEIKPSSRPHIAKKNFAQPGKQEDGHKGKYPITDRQHASSALGFAKMHHDSAALAAVKAKIRQKYPDMLDKTAGRMDSLERAGELLKHPATIPYMGLGAGIGGLMTYLASRPKKELGGKSNAEEEIDPIVNHLQKREQEIKNPGLGRLMGVRGAEFNQGVAQAFRKHPIKASLLGAAIGARGALSIADLLGAYHR